MCRDKMKIVHIYTQFKIFPNALTGTCCTWEVIVWVGMPVDVAKRGVVVSPWNWVWTVTAGWTFEGEDDKLRVVWVTVLGLPTAREFSHYTTVTVMDQFQTCWTVGTMRRESIRKEKLLPHFQGNVRQSRARTKASYRKLLSALD